MLSTSMIASIFLYLSSNFLCAADSTCSTDADNCAVESLGKPKRAEALLAIDRQVQRRGAVGSDRSNPSNLNIKVKTKCGKKPLKQCNKAIKKCIKKLEKKGKDHDTATEKCLNQAFYQGYTVKWVKKCQKCTPMAIKEAYDKALKKAGIEDPVIEDPGIEDIKDPDIEDPVIDPVIDPVTEEEEPVTKPYSACPGMDGEYNICIRTTPTGPCLGGSLVIVTVTGNVVMAVDHTNGDVHHGKVSFHFPTGTCKGNMLFANGHDIRYKYDREDKIITFIWDKDDTFHNKNHIVQWRKSSR